jgi:uncharacterized surface protein with fasciclin (FAS1) repeats
MKYPVLLVPLCLFASLERGSAEVSASISITGSEERVRKSAVKRTRRNKRRQSQEPRDHKESKYAGPSVANLLNNTYRFQVFDSLSDITGLTNLFADVHTRSTVFAPSNEAFEKLPTDLTPAYVSPEFGLHLFDIMSYHVISDAVLFSSHFCDGMEIPTEQKLNEKLLVSIRNGDIYILTESVRDHSADSHVPSTKIVTAEVAAVNGVVHSTDFVFFPRFVYQSITNKLDGLEQFSTLARMLATMDMYEALGGFTGTLLAPTNSAFQSLGKETLSELEINRVLLEQTLAYHIVLDVFNYDFANDGAHLETALGLPVVFTQRYPPAFNGHAAVDFHLFATGVIYEIDTVLTFQHVSLS